LAGQAGQGREAGLVYIFIDYAGRPGREGRPV